MQSFANSLIESESVSMIFVNFAYKINWDIHPMEVSEGI